MGCRNIINRENSFFLNNGETAWEGNLKCLYVFKKVIVLNFYHFNDSLNKHYRTDIDNTKLVLL